MRHKHFYIYGYGKSKNGYYFDFSIMTFYKNGGCKEIILNKSLPMESQDLLNKRIWDGYIICKTYLEKVKPGLKLYHYYDYVDWKATYKKWNKHNILDKMIQQMNPAQ